MINHRLRSSLLSIVWIFTLTACMNFHVGTLPPPPQDARLRVYVQPVSTAGPRQGFGTSHEEFAEKQYKTVREYLEETGIYQVVAKEDVAAVTGDQMLTRSRLERNDWELARKIGKAVHAEYVMITERAKTRAELGTTSFVFTNLMINTGTGKKYGARYEVRRNIKADHKERRDIIKKTYREIFRSAKEDMLATALRKAERIQEAPKPAAGSLQKPETPAPVIEEAKTTPPVSVGRRQTIQPVQPVAPEKPIQTASTPAQPLEDPKIAASADAVHASPEIVAQEDSGPEQIPDYIKVVKEPEGLVQAGPGTGTARLVVYDLEAPEQYKAAALIISDALREELFQFKNFTLVNRENLQQVLQEMAMQQTGLVDEKEAVRLGRGLAANQIVTGRLGLLGKTTVLQAKRVDVETFATLGIASERSARGREEEIMEKLPAFVKHLADSKGVNK